jgi:hypothetical protein
MPTNLIMPALRAGAGNGQGAAVAEGTARSRLHTLRGGRSPELAPEGDDPGGGERLVDGGGDDRASENEGCEDGDDTNNSQEGVQGSHHGHSRVLRGTLCGQNGRRDIRVPSCLCLSCGQAERCLN